MSKFADSTAERCQVVGTSGIISLLGNINKHRTFANSGVGEEVYIRVETSAGLWEVSVGEFDSEANTITRTELVSSITGSAINFPAGTHTCYSVLPADKVGGGDGFSWNPEQGRATIGGWETGTQIYAGDPPAGTDIEGNDFDILPGASTGAGEGGDVVVWAGQTGAPGNTQNSLSPAFRFSTKGNDCLLPIKLPTFVENSATSYQDGFLAMNDNGLGFLISSGGVWVAL